MKKPLIDWAFDIAILACVAIAAWLLIGCSTEPDPRDEIRPKRFEPCEVKVIDGHTGEERCISRARLCRELVNCTEM